jgi:hypothetical protein
MIARKGVAKTITGEFHETQFINIRRYAIGGVLCLASRQHDCG